MKEKPQEVPINPDNPMGGPEINRTKYQKPELITPLSEVKSEIQCGKKCPRWYNI